MLRAAMFMFIGLTEVASYSLTLTISPGEICNGDSDINLQYITVRLWHLFHTKKNYFSIINFYESFLFSPLQSLTTYEIHAENETSHPFVNCKYTLTVRRNLYVYIAQNEFFVGI